MVAILGAYRELIRQVTQHFSGYVIARTFAKCSISSGVRVSKNVSWEMARLTESGIMIQAKK